ncbi:MAG: hypothetical protein Q9225_002627, partial [Loekoesia sp. 1 TL-2023]
MTQEREPPILEYARYYGLSRNHLEVNPLGALPPPDDSVLQLDDESLWLQLSARAASPQAERLVAVKEASALLATTNSRQYEGCNFEGVDTIPTHRVRDIKHELPLLRTDHEIDMLNFVHHIDPNLADEFFPSEKVDDEQDEGLRWPSKCLELPELLFHKAQTERLEMARGVLEYVKGILDIGVQKGDEPTFEYELPTYTRNRLRDAITPPLLPRSPSPRPFEPSSETGHLDLLSDHSSPTRQEIERIDKELLEQDALIPLKRRTSAGDDPELSDIDSVGDLYSPLKGIKSTPPPPICKRSRRQDLKVEGPLTPPASDQPPPWDSKKVSFSEALQEMIPSFPPPISEPEQLSPEDIDVLFAEQIAPIAAKAERKIEQEQLQEADTTSRVPVPVMDFAKPIPPWVIPPSGSTNEWKTRFLRDMKAVHLNLPSWKFDRQTERTKLSWVPFPMSLGRFELQDTIVDDGSVAAFITQPEPIDPDTLTWKPQGLRLLDEIHESDEEELECGNFSPAKDVQSLVKRRKSELHKKEEIVNLLEDARDHLRTNNVTNNGGYSIKKPPPPKAGIPVMKDDQVAATSRFSAMNALDQFLGLRRGELQKGYESRNTRPPQAVSMSALDVSEPHNPIAPNVAEKSKPVVPRLELKVPDVPCYIVASTSFLSNRKLARQIKDLYPSADIIERDFTPHNLQPAYTGPSLVPPRRGLDALLDEADLILSPSTGLILTSLQKIKQQSLPGQSTRSPVRERLERTAI